MDISGQVLSVTGRNVNTKFGQKTVYDIVFSNGKTYSSWDAEVATKAQTYAAQKDVNGNVTQPAQQVDARTVVKGDGKYEDIMEIALSGQLAQAAVALANGSTTIPTPAIPIAPISSGGMSPERESKIVKQSCLSTAFNFVGNLWNYGDDGPYNEAIESALELAKTLYAEVYGQQNVAQSPTEVAAQVNQVIPEAVSVGAGTPDW
jgi:hypothetical protein